jgi:SAM-dependent methyltransferase
MMQSKFAYRLFGKMARLYTRFLQMSGYAQSVEFFVSHLPLSTDQPLRVLDVGSGTGIYTMAIARRFSEAEIVAFDLNADMIEQLKTDMQAYFPQTRLQAFTHDIYEPLDSTLGTFDLLITSGILEYTPLKKTVAQFGQLVRPGGIVCYSPMRDSFYGRFIGKIYQTRPYTREDSRAAFEAAGFQRTQLVTLPWYHPASFKELQIFEK